MFGLDDVRKAKADIDEAVAWQKLPKEPRLRLSTLDFCIREGACNDIRLQRIGQKKDGDGDNISWPSPPGLSDALLTVIIEQIDYLFPLALDILKNKHQRELTGSKYLIDKMQCQIDQAKSEVE